MKIHISPILLLARLCEGVAFYPAEDFSKIFSYFNKKKQHPKQIDSVVAFL